MNCTRWFCLTTALLAYTVTGNAGTLYTFGGDFVSPGATGAPDILNSMNPASVSSVIFGSSPLGGGNIGFNGGLVAFGSLLYGIGNDSGGVATLYSMATDGTALTPVSSAFNNTGDAAGVPFQNGLTVVGSTFYAIGEDGSLYQIGNGSAGFVQTLNTFGGTYAGLAWDTTLNAFYAIVANGTTGDYLVQFALGGSATQVANLSALDGAPIGTHLGGLADAGGGILYDIYTNPSFTGELEQINVSGTPNTSPLYDTQIPLAQNAGIAITPEPATGLQAGTALLVLGAIVRRFSSAKRHS